MEGEIKNLIEVCSAILASLCYCYFISSKFPKGIYRLASLFPVFYVFTLLPLRFNTAFFTAVAAFFITWLANFKLLLFAFDLGPLSPKPTLPLFITIACFPVRTKKTQIQSNSSKSPLNLPTELIIFSLTIGLLEKYRETLHPVVIQLLYCCLVFLFVDIIIAASNVVVRAISKLEMEPPSDEPYLATSLQDFWGKRWNLMVTNTLRHTVYKPVRSAVEPVIGKKTAPLVGVFMTFLVSGLMHELLFYYVTMVRPTWEVTGFFVLHGLSVVVEFVAKRAAARRGWRLNWAVSGPLTVGFVVVTSFWLFFPPLMRSGADVMVIEEFKLTVNFLKTSVTKCTSYLVGK